MRSKRTDELVSLCEAVGFIEQGVGVDAIAVELMPVGLDPVLHDFGGHLGVKLQTKASSEDVGLGPGIAARDQLGAAWKGERVEVPVEPRACRDELRVVRLDWQPADFRAG
jgi:hypothetical protein